MVLQSPELRSLDTCLRSLKARWQEYRDQGNFEHFVEFTLALDNLTEHLNRLKLPGLLRQCEGLENAALALFGDESFRSAPAMRPPSSTRSTRSSIRSRLHRPPRPAPRKINAAVLHRHRMPRRNGRNRVPSG